MPELLEQHVFKSKNAQQSFLQDKEVIVRRRNLIERFLLVALENVFLGHEHVRFRDHDWLGVFRVDRWGLRRLWNLDSFLLFTAGESEERL